ncbi:hypothetical protein H1C71_015606 [Ictidomys tridecemlineatus]|nr:hypothetical protein H1C71_015606 [Ictidomys tridecemlineatus]
MVDSQLSALCQLLRDPVLRGLALRGTCTPCGGLQAGGNAHCSPQPYLGKRFMQAKGKRLRVEKERSGASLTASIPAQGLAWATLTLKRKGTTGTDQSPGPLP